MSDSRLGTDTVASEPGGGESAEAQRGYRALARNLPDIVYRIHLGPPLRKELFNDRLTEITGHSAGDLDPTALSLLEPHILADDKARVRDRVAAAVRQRSDFELAYRVRARDGAILDFSEHGRVVCGADRRPVTIDGVIRDVTAQRRADEALRHSHRLMSYIIEHNRSAIAVHDRDLRYLFVSKRYLEEYNVKEADVIGKHHYEVFPDLPQKWRDVHQRALAGEVVSAEDDPYERADGAVEWTRWECRPWFEADGGIGGIIVYTEVITERKRAEAERERLQQQLSHAVKMESIGRLAGGVAHDFNNMLGVILGRADLALRRANPAQPIWTDLQEIRRAAERSADLTRQLLAFARKQTVAPTVLDLNQVVERMLKLLRRLIGEHIELAWHPSAEAALVRIDPSQVDQILANLCVNARDAIGDSGHVTIETALLALDETDCREHAGAPPGDYVLLTVSDSGCGMDVGTRAHLFEPFFTTKEMGRGTGLGLSTVYGIVNQNNGFIDVQSEPGQGATFRIYLPRVTEGSAVAVPEDDESTVPRGSETLLLVEDDASVRRLTAAMLEQLGYRVLVTGRPEEALELAGRLGHRIDLLITDVVMPGMNGRQLASMLAGTCPGTRCLFVSGYTANVIAHHDVLEQGVAFLAKPFSIGQLARKVREVLGAR